MPSERWQQIEHICHAALERPESQRDTFLEEACGGDEALRREVEALLQHDQEAEGFLEKPALELAAEVLAEDRTSSMVGRNIGVYRILSLLGAGGMGTVYLAEDTRLDRKVALKFLPEEMEQDAAARARFLREAKSAAALDHPYICKIFEIGEAEGTPYIAMEYVEGTTLKERFSGIAPPLKEVLQTALEIAEALEAAHRKNIIHRDLKPSNLMLTSEGHVKVMDFGLAKRSVPDEGIKTQEQSITASLTQTGITLGTLAYMSPEQLRGQKVDARSDIFCFGVTLYEMLAGVHPFKKSQQIETSAAILTEIPPPLSRYANQASPVLQHIVKKMLAKEPDRRYQLIHDVRVDLADLMDEVTDSRIHPDETATGSRQVGAQVDERPRRWELPWILTAMMTILLGVALWGPWRTAPIQERPMTRFAISLPQGRTLATGASYVAISPDGTLLAYVATTENNQKRRLYLHPLNQLESRLIPGAEEPSHPVFSPDGKWLAFCDGTNGFLQKVSLSGGSPQTLCDYGNIGKGWQFGQSWTPDGDALIFGSDSGLLQVSAEGGNPRTLTRVGEGEITHSWPQILPGGKAVLFSVGEPGRIRIGQPNSIALLSLESGERRTLIKPGTHARYLPTGHLLYAWGGKLLAAPFDLDELKLTGPPTTVLEGISMYHFGKARFSVSDNGSLAYIPAGIADPGAPFTLVWVDRNGEEEPLAAEPRPYRHPRISPGGSHVAVTVTESGNTDLWVYDLARQVPTRLTFDPATDSDPLWTLDGLRLVFTSTRDGAPWNLFWKAADGTGQVERLTTSLNPQEPYSFSPDGQRLVFMELNPETSWDLAVLSMESGSSSKPLLQTQFNEWRPHISPDGRWVAYTSNESGRFEVYVRPFPKTKEGKWQISSGGRNLASLGTTGERIVLP